MSVRGAMQRIVMTVSDLMVTGYVNVETFIFVKYLYSGRESRAYILLLISQQKNTTTSFMFTRPYHK